MGEFGERLRQAREAKGVSLAEIAAQTRIGVRMLQALETEQIDQLPGGVFNRSFLRQYAAFLDLEQESFVQDYLQRLEPRREVPVEPSAPTTLPVSVGGAPALRWVLGSVALVLLVAGIWFFPRRDRSSSETPQLAAAPQIAESSEATTPSTAPSKAGRQSEPERSASSGQNVSTAEQPGASPGADSAEPVAPALPVTEPVATPARPSTPILPAVAPGGDQVLVLQINARSVVWLSITADGQQLWQGILQPEQSREVEATDSIQVKVGNAGGVEMTLNGESLGALGQEGEVRTITLAAGGLNEPVF